MCDLTAKEHLGKHQIIHVVAFVANYLTENSLCVAYDEIAQLKKILASASGSEIKLKQKRSCVSLCANGGKYYFKTKITVPPLYPAEGVRYVMEQPVTFHSLIRFAWFFCLFQLEQLREQFASGARPLFERPSQRNIEKMCGTATESPQGHTNIHHTTVTVQNTRLSHRGYQRFLHRSLPDLHAKMFAGKSDRCHR